MPEEIFIIVMLSIIAFAVVLLAGLRTAFSLVRRKQDQEAANKSSLTTSDLEGMMRKAVSDAVAPLSAKIDDLEHRLDAAPPARLLNAPSRPDLLDLEEDEATPEAVSRRRSRQSH